jgi:PIN domain nuclease of toxin-antitoxin system
MTNTIVLDSSAILALLNDEPGANKVEAVLDHAIVGAANLAEIAAKLSE